MSPARIILSTGSLYTLETGHVFALAAETGFDGIEIMCDPRPITRDPAALQALSEQYTLPILTLHSPFLKLALPDWEDAQDEVSRVCRTLQLAERLNAESIVVHLPWRIGVKQFWLSSHFVSVPWPFERRYNRMKMWIANELAAVQRGTPVRIAIENMPVRSLLGLHINASWWNSIDEWSRVHDWLTLDTTHWGTLGINPVDAYRAARERVQHVHLSNYDGREHRLPHRGHLDLAAFLQALAADDFAGTVSLEAGPDVLEAPDENAIRRNLQASIDFMRQHLNHS